MADTQKALGQKAIAIAQVRGPMISNSGAQATAQVAVSNPQAGPAGNVAPDGKQGSGGATSAHVIVLGNEKGGSGKSTMAMHIAVALMRAGFSVACIDLDARQRTLARYLDNRQAYAAAIEDASLDVPDLRVIERCRHGIVEVAEREEYDRFTANLTQLKATNDFVVIDSPGSDSHLSRLGHSYADILITPMNDSFVDLDLLTRVDPGSHEIQGPSLYAEMVWECRKRRAMRDRGSIDWVVMRNRISSLDAKNKRRVGEVLNKLAPRIGFRTAVGFGERVIYRELFLKGLTLMDLRENGLDVPLTMSHVAARQEVRTLINMLNLPALKGQEIAL